jgi:hypothetical protein
MTAFAGVAAAVGAAAAVIGGGVGAYGAIESSQASSEAANYQAQVSANNAKIASQNAEYATAAGEAQVTQSQLKTADVVGAIKTNEAASGLDVNSGSNVDVQSSAKELGELDALTIRNAAARQAYGYQTQSMSDVASGQLQQAQASQDITAGMFGAGSSILGGVSSAANQYGRYLQLNGGGTGSGGTGSIDNGTFG